MQEGQYMRERPILFSGAMVRAILDGTKTQTRRGVKSPAQNMQKAGMEVIKRREPGDLWYRDHVWSMRNSMGVWGDYTHEMFLDLCPYGAPGDRLWVRETFLVDDFRADIAGNLRRANDDQEMRAAFLREAFYRADGECCDQIAECQCEGRPGWKPSIHMPRWASRLTLEITGVRVERVQDISDDDIRAEGMMPNALAALTGRPLGDFTPASGLSLFDLWRVGWTEINGAESWAANPYVWVVDFKRVTP